MEMAGAQTIAAGRDVVWAALNDPEVLKDCIPGCESIAPTGENQYSVVMKAAIGPVKAKFDSRLELSDIVPSTSYTMTFNASGGAAGFGKGRTTVALATTENSSTQLSYTVEAQVGGKLAQVGARLIDGVARKLADDFFTRFKARVEPSEAAKNEAADAPAPQTESAAEVSVQTAPAASRTVKSRSVWTWGLAAVVIIVAACLWFGA